MPPPIHSPCLRSRKNPIVIQSSSPLTAPHRYLRPATGNKLWCRVDVNSVGTRAVVMTATTWTTDPDKPTGIAQGTFSLSKKQDKARLPRDDLSTKSSKQEVNPWPKGGQSTVAAAPGVNPAAINDYGTKHMPTIHSVFGGFQCEEVEIAQYLYIDASRSVLSFSRAQSICICMRIPLSLPLYQYV